MQNTPQKSKCGFTLVETMIVVGIIDTLAGIAIPGLVRNKREAHDAAAKVTLKTISTSMENYMAINREYPTDVNDLLVVTPPYLKIDYFTGTHEGFTYFVDSLTVYSYQVTAEPISANHGTQSFTITTGGVITPN